MAGHSLPTHQAYFCPWFQSFHLSVCSRLPTQPALSTQSSSLQTQTSVWPFPSTLSLKPATSQDLGLTLLEFLSLFFPGP